MNYVQNNINFILLGLIIVVALAFAGVTTFYQRNYSNLTENYDVKLEHLDELTSQLQSQKAQLNKTSSELLLKEQRETNLQTQYGDLRSRNEQLERDLSVLQDDYAGKVRQLTDVQNKLQEKEAEVISFREILTRRINDLIADLATVQNELEECQS